MDDESLGPIYPAWMRKPDGGVRIPPRPSADFCETVVNQSWSDFQNMRIRFQRDVDLVRQTIGGTFPGFNPNIDKQMFSAELANQITAIAAMIAAIEPVAIVPYRSVDEQAASQSIENFALWFIRQLQRYHRLGGNSDFLWEATWYGLVYGRVAVRIMLDPSDTGFPWDVSLLDPGTVMPYWGDGKRGLKYVARRYKDRIGSVLDAFDTDGRIYDKFAAKADADRGDPHRGLDLTNEVEVLEYCDRWWRWISVDGIEVLPVTEHEYGFVPYRVYLANGEPVGAVTPDRPLTRDEVERGMGGVSSKETNQIYKGTAFFEHARRAHEQLEGVMGILYRGLRKAVDPTIVTTTPYNTPPEQWSSAPGDENFARPGEQRAPAPTTPSPIDLQPLLAKLREDLVKAGLPDHLYGLNEDSNVSGFAVESLIAAAKHKIQPYIDLQETVLGDICSCALSLFQNWGYLAAPDGALTVPVRGRAGAAASTTNPPEQVITRDMIELVGTDVEIKLHSVALQNMTAMMNVAKLAVDANLWSRQRANEWLGEHDPMKLMEQILSEQAMTDPDILQFVTYPRALEATGNYEGLMMYLLAKVLPQLFGSGGTAGGQPGGAAPSGGGPQTVQGSSQPQVGQGPGPGSGPTGGGGGITGP